MKSYKQYLLEGIVEVDKDILTFLTDFTLYTLFGNIILHPSYKDEDEKLVNDIFTKYKKQYLASKKNVMVYDTEGNIVLIDLVSDKYKLGVKYDNPVDLEFKVPFDYVDKSMLGGFGSNDHTNYIIVNFNSYKLMKMITGIINGGYLQKEIDHFYNTVKNIIDHELIHSIRENLHKIKSISLPKDKNKDSGDRDKDYVNYLTADVEIESWVINTIYSFKNIIEYISNDIKIPNSDKLLLIKYWLGVRNSSTNKAYEKYNMYYDKNEIKNIEFFISGMKKEEPKRYKNVINKIYQNLYNWIN